MNPFLRQLDVSNFRKLKGHSSIPLDARIVLVHGPNGSGKTSLLSAIEFALTGTVRALEKVESRYTAYLPSHGTPFATTSIQVAGRPPEAAIPLTVGADGVRGEPALDAEQSKFFSERSFLDQSSLGRLLELYQDETDGKTALARFVNELLRLDQLEALENGLDSVGHIARFKRLTPEYAQAQSRLVQVQLQADEVGVDLDETEAGVRSLKASLLSIMDELELQTGSTEDPVAWKSRLASVVEESGPTTTLLPVAELRGKLAASNSILTAAASLPEASLESAEQALEAWLAGNASELEIASSGLAALGFEIANAPNKIREELRAIQYRKSQSESASAELANLKRREADLLRELGILDGDLRERHRGIDPLAAALSALMPHIAGEVCPVCDRDWATEDTTTTLLQHVEGKLEELSAMGSELGRLADLRERLHADRADLERQMAQLRAHVLTQPDAALLTSRASDLAAAQEMLTTANDLQEVHERLRSAVASAQRHVATQRSAQAEIDSITSLIRSAGMEHDLPDVERSSPVELLDALELRINSDKARLEERSALATNGLRIIEDLSQLSEKATSLTIRLATFTRESREIETKIAAADAVRLQARQLVTSTGSARAHIVDTVFTAGLNRVWRDIFTRLAPQEEFVPTFAPPQSTRRGLQLRIETLTASGVRAGAPEAMLSAGNLNTAALSLFLALHLAVEPQVPCLIFDDPVQSMDEVHVSQFAALIRLVARQHDRQVILAVHERELFEYLKLELSPATQDEALITIELGTATLGTPQVETNRINFAPDALFAG